MIESSNHVNHLGTLGSGNHFVEICLETSQGPAAPATTNHNNTSSNGNGGDQRPVWFMIHSGSRGVGGRIGSIFITLARDDMGNLISQLPDKDLAYLQEGTPHFEEYIAAVHWAQDYARWNRELMMQNMIRAIRDSKLIGKRFTTNAMAVNCHHNYVERYTMPTTLSVATVEGEPLQPQRQPSHVWLTRKGATSARLGELAVIPGSMGAASYIVKGKGNELSYQSCSHGAGRRYSRGEAKRRFTTDDLIQATEGVECRKDHGVLDETPQAYKSIEAVMQAQADLVDVVCILKQVMCIKG